jgi:hypothetical protein
VIQVGANGKDNAICKQKLFVCFLNYFFLKKICNFLVGDSNPLGNYGTDIETTPNVRKPWIVTVQPKKITVQILETIVSVVVLLS